MHYYLQESQEDGKCHATAMRYIDVFVIIVTHICLSIYTVSGCYSPALTLGVTGEVTSDGTAQGSLMEVSHRLSACTGAIPKPGQSSPVNKLCNSIIIKIKKLLVLYYYHVIIIYHALNQVSNAMSTFLHQIYSSQCTSAYPQIKMYNV